MSITLTWNTAGTTLDSTNYVVKLGDIITQNNINTILNYKYCGYQSFFNDYLQYNASNDIEYGSRNQPADRENKFPVLIGASSGGYIVQQDTGRISLWQYDTELPVYCFSTFIATKNTNIPAGWLQYNSSNFENNVRFVEQITGIQKCYIDSGLIAENTRYEIADKTTKHFLKCTCNTDITNVQACEKLTDTNNDDWYIIPVLVWQVNNFVYITTCDMQSNLRSECYDWRFYKPTASKDFTNTGNYLWFGHNITTEQITMYDWDNATSTQGTATHAFENYYGDNFNVNLTCSYASGFAQASFFFMQDLNFIGMFNVVYGLYFKNEGTMYKPIISGGVVTGYTSDFNTSSDIDTWQSSSDHEIPDTPPHDESLKDELDDIGLTLNANGNSFINYYACTSSNLTALLAWCNTQTEFNGIDWIVGVKQAPCDIPTISSTESTTIHLKNVDTGVTGYSIKNQGSYSTTSIQTYNINRIHGNFLDYEPYTHIDLYVPFCGSVSLPPALFMGRTLKTEMIYDIFSGECSCAIFADNTFYTSVGGVFMTQQAVTAEQMGSIHNAVVNGAMSLIGGGVSTVAGVATGNPLMAVGGAVTMAGGAVKSYQTINSISPEVRGNSGGRCNFYKPDCYTLLITTPNNITDSEFKKYNGYISNKTLTLSQNMGYTVINNPVITGNMTQQERQEIESYMKSGIIL